MNPAGLNVSNLVALLSRHDALQRWISAQILWSVTGLASATMTSVPCAHSTLLSGADSRPASVLMAATGMDAMILCIEAVLWPQVNPPAEAACLDANTDLADYIEELNASRGLPANLTAMGFTADHIPGLAEHAVPDVCTFTNPRPASVDDYARLIEAALS